MQNHPSIAQASWHWRRRIGAQTLLPTIAIDALSDVASAA
jgi:hypothetical protein